MLEPEDGYQALEVLCSVETRTADEAGSRQEALGLKGTDVSAGRPGQPRQFVEHEPTHTAGCNTDLCYISTSQKHGGPEMPLNLEAYSTAFRPTESP